MAEKKSFLLRLESDLFDELRRQAASELRSVNGQIEFILRTWIQKRRGGEKGEKGDKGSGKLGSDSN